MRKKVSRNLRPIRIKRAWGDVGWPKEKPAAVTALTYLLRQSRYTRDELREYARSRNIPIGRNKEDTIKNIAKYATVQIQFQ